MEFIIILVALAAFVYFVTRKRTNTTYPRPVTPYNPRPLPPVEPLDPPTSLDPQVLPDVTQNDVTK